MDSKRLRLLLILPALLLTACTTDMQTSLSEDGVRARTIETLVGDPSARDEVIDRLLSTPDERNALFGRIIANEEIASALVERLTQSERGRALVASRIASDVGAMRSFIGMMMLTGGVGEMVTQEQAECLELGDALAHGNQRRTMVDLKRLGQVLDEWWENRGSYPICEGFEVVTGCLASSLPDDALADLRLNDAWGRPFLYYSDVGGTSYGLISYATDGKYDRLGKAGPTLSYNADIVFSDGDFVQWPGHIVKDRIR
jgi:hypothetical protein